MTIVKTTLPQNSRLNIINKKFDYIDSFRGTLNDDRNALTSADIGKAFFSSAPKWVEKLFAIRNKIVFVFGLKTSGNTTDRERQLKNFKCEPGERLGLFKVFHKSESEVILGEDDKHLNFRISLFLEQSVTSANKKDLIISTTVEFKNQFGRLYFFPVRPFHQVIVPAMLKRMIKELEKQNITGKKHS